MVVNWGHYGNGDILQWHVMAKHFTVILWDYNMALRSLANN